MAPVRKETLSLLFRACDSGDDSILSPSRYFTLRSPLGVLVLPLSTVRIEMRDLKLRFPGRCRVIPGGFNLSTVPA
jgi:hypothetical protein